MVYHYKNHILSEDNWFTSPEQQEYCLNLGIHCNGTVKANRKNILKEAIFKDTGAQKKARGVMQCMECNRKGKKFYFTSWMDSKPVHMLHTYPTMSHPIMRKGTDASGNYTRIQINQPTIIADCNEGMGGTDLGDQRDSYYRFDHRTTQWPHRIYSQFIMVSITNAYILWKMSNPERAKVRQLEFMINLMHQLAQYRESVEDSDSEPMEVVQVADNQDKSKRRSSTWLNDTCRLTGTHTPMKIEGHNNRGRCKAACQDKSYYYCDECQAFLCLKGAKEESC